MASHPLRPTFWPATECVVPTLLNENDIEALMQIRDPQHLYALCLTCIAPTP
jgi:hypothetical protein